MNERSFLQKAFPHGNGHMTTFAALYVVACSKHVMLNPWHLWAASPVGLRHSQNNYLNSSFPFQLVDLLGLAMPFCVFLFVTWLANNVHLQTLAYDRQVTVRKSYLHDREIYLSRIAIWHFLWAVQLCAITWVTESLLAKWHLYTEMRQLRKKILRNVAQSFLRNCMRVATVLVNLVLILVNFVHVCDKKTDKRYFCFLLWLHTFILTWKRVDVWIGLFVLIIY